MEASRFSRFAVAQNEHGAAACTLPRLHQFDAVGAIPGSSTLTSLDLLERGADVTGRQMRTHFTICPKRPWV
jgi:hypothetical protein